MSDGKIETRSCKLLNQDLVYLFAMRPAYGKKSDSEKSDQVGRFPSVFVIDPTHLGTPYHVYPFDTGAALEGIFGATPNPTVFFEDYELQPSIEAVSGQIDWAFGSRYLYYKGQVREDIYENLPQFDEVARSYVAIAELASSKKTNAPDRRASTIEVAYKKHIPLSSCRLVIVPKQYIEDIDMTNSAFLNSLAAHNIPFRIYDWQPNTLPYDYREVLSDILEEFFHSVGSFSV